MEDLIDSNIIVNTIRMELIYELEKYGFQPFPYLIVEGITDISFFKKFCTEDCNFKKANGKENVIEIVTTLKKEDCIILGIVDTDFWYLDNIKCENPNILITDLHDIEIMMLETQAFDSILAEFGIFKKIAKLERKKNITLKKLLYDECSKIGYIRWFTKKNIDFSELRLKRLKFDNFFDSDNFVICEDRLIQTILKNTKDWTMLKTNLDVIYATNVDKNFIKNLIHKSKDSKIDLRHLCRGHDLTKVLVIGLIKNFGNDTNPNFPSCRKNLESSLRLSYTLDNFLQTQLYSSIKKWEIINKGYQILRD